jgi:hypothetical protein
VSLTYQSKLRDRVYVRKFDHEDARRRHQAGESISSLAQEYGVSHNAVLLVVSDQARATRRAYEEWQKTAGRCRRCGAPMHIVSFYRGSRFCRDCALDNLATSVGDGVLRCTTCREWKPDEDFPRNRREPKRRRGRHHQCRACCTRRRQEYREKNKVPCIGCGTLVLRPSEKGRRRAPWPRCRSCAQRGIRPEQAATTGEEEER